MEEKQFQVIVNALRSIHGNLSKICIDSDGIDRTSVMYYLSKAYSDFSRLETIHYINPCNINKIDELIDEYKVFSNVADHYIDGIEHMDSLLDSCREINSLINELDELLFNKVR